MAEICGGDEMKGYHPGMYMYHGSNISGFLRFNEKITKGVAADLRKKSPYDITPCGRAWSGF